MRKRTRKVAEEHKHYTGRGGRRERPAQETDSGEPREGSVSKRKDE